MKFYTKQKQIKKIMSCHSFLSEQPGNFTGAQQNIHWNRNFFVNNPRYGHENISESMRTNQFIIHGHDK